MTAVNNVSDDRSLRSHRSPAVLDQCVGEPMHATRSLPRARCRGGDASHQRRQRAPIAAPRHRDGQLHRDSSSSSFSCSSSRRTTFSSTGFRLLPASFVLLILLSLLLGSASATLSDPLRDRQRSAELAGFSHLTPEGVLLIDRSEPPEPRLPHLRRNEKEKHASSSYSVTTIPTPSHTKKDQKAASTEAPSATTASANATTTISSATSSATTLETAPLPTGSLPIVFDTNLAGNFTSETCPTFFTKFMGNDTFQACHPLSLLLFSSNSFFDASKSFVRITQTLEATCNVNFAGCQAMMQSYSKQILNDDVCGRDYRNGNAMVLQAYKGFMAYQPLYEAGCQRDGKGNYCFANAITNKSSPADSHPYYLALGYDLPGSSRPTCNQCLQNTMSVFQQFAGSSAQPISTTYVKAAQQINIGCGPTFINTTVISNGAGPGAAAPATSLLALLASLLALVLLV